VAKRPPPSLSTSAPSPRFRHQVNVDNDSSRTFTMVEVFTEDKPGVLYTITHTLAEQGLDIHRSRVGVAADRVADIFYVRDTRRARRSRTTRASRASPPRSS
jgi:[protein-PII] uridylyltransferase